MTSEELRDAFHYLYRAELPALKQLARSLPDNPFVVNIGAGAGTSGLAFLESRPDLHLFTIDIENGDSPLGSLYSEREVFKAAGLGEAWLTRWYQLCLDSKEAGRQWLQVRPKVPWFDGHLEFQLVPIDMVFIDGDHSYEGCKGDIDAWLPNLKPGGILAIHDYNKQLLAVTPDGPHPRAWEGVNQAVDELLAKGWQALLYVDSLIAFRVPEAI